MFPPLWQSQSCLLCHDAAAHSGICTACRTDLRQLVRHGTDLCPQCGNFSHQAAVCHECRSHPPPYSRFWASAAYLPPVPALLHDWKHLKQSGLFHIMLLLMQQNPPPWLLQQRRNSALLAMPVSSARRIQRGFNQCDELADALGKALRIAVLPHHTVTREHRPPQSTLGGLDERRHNIRGCFSLADTHAVRGKTIVLIDDVATTCATTAELAHTLLQQGASDVRVWVLAANFAKKT